MALYTHFGGVPGLVDEVVREGLARFAAHVRETTPETDDPMRDLLAGGIAYGEFAIQNPQLYRLMFGLSDSARLRGFATEADAAGATWTMAEGVDAFSVLLGSVERVIEAGRIRAQDARAAATQVLSVTHGFVLLAIGGFIGDIGQAIEEVMIPLTINLMVGLGDERERVERSLAAANTGRGRWASPSIAGSD
jgi:AcrR family transcriptional regulator